MAGNTLTIGARFKPMSYAEMIAPIQGANIEYKTQQEELDKLTQASSVWENMANKETDRLAYQKYTNYATELKQSADALASQGLTPNTRKAISQMKGKYQSDIVPIEQAYKQRAQMAEQYNKALMQNPTLMSNINPSKLSLDRLIANPSLTPEYYSGNLLAEQVANQAKALATQLRESGQWESTADGQMLERIEKYGLSPQDVQLVQSGQGPKALQNLVNNVIKASPIGKWENAKELLPRAYQYAASGLYAGIGKEDIKIGQDQSYITPELKYRMRKDAEAEQAKKDQLQEAYKNRPASWESLNSQVDATNSPVVKAYNKDKEFIENYMKLGPSFLNQTKEGKRTFISTPSGGGNPYAQMGSSNVTRRQDWVDMTEKYGTESPAKILEIIEKGIKNSTSEYRQTAIKAKDNSNLNTFLLSQLGVYGEKALPELVKAEDGKKLTLEEIRDAFGKEGRLKYNAETKKLGIINPSISNPKAKHINYTIDKSAVRAVKLPLINEVGNVVKELTGTDYLNYVDWVYQQDPTNTYINILMSTFYDAMDSYGNQFVQSAPASNAKAIVTEIE